MIITAGIILLSIAGCVISYYFMAVSYGKMSPRQFFIPEFCRLDTGTCETLFSTREARIFGPSNAAIALCYYGLLVAATVTGWLDQKSIGSMFLLFSWISIVVSLYLGYRLLYKLKTSCTLCFASHGVNFLLSIFLFLRVKGM